MQVNYIINSTILFVATFSAINLNAQTTAKLVMSAEVWASDKHIVDSDIVRLDNQWIMAICENAQADRREGVVRIIGSMDGSSWESKASIGSPTAGKLLSQPRITFQPGGQMMLTATAIVANKPAVEPIPEFGGTVQTVAWYSGDGRTWSQSSPFGSENYVHGKAVWFDAQAYSYSRGCICGNAQTVKIVSIDKTGLAMKTVYTETFAAFFPDDASLMFAGDLGVCLLSRMGARGEIQTGLIGKSRAPFNQWDWQESDSCFSSPNLIQLADKRVLVAVGLHTPRPRKMLCELNVDTGKLTELLVLPSMEAYSYSGMVVHDGHLWISSQQEHDGKRRAYLTKILVN